MKTSQEFGDFKWSKRTLFTSVSTVSKSHTSNDGWGKDLVKEVGNRLVQVSSPANTTRLALLTSWSMMLSSEISAEAKLLETSMNVGRLPVVRPFSLCMVVVGGSARNLNSLPEVRPDLGSPLLCSSNTGSLF